MSVNVRSVPHVTGLSVSWPWLHSQRWDLTFILGSCVLVAAPVLLHYQFGVSTTTINILVAALVGGPHLYSTYILTALEPTFWRRHPLFTLGALVVPMVVVPLAILDLTLLITGFLFWASLHVLQQIAWIGDCYRARAGEGMAGWSRASDYLVLFASLYPIAVYRMASGSFLIEDRLLPIPDLFRSDWFVALTWLGFGLALSAWIAKTVWETRARALNGPKTLLIAVTVAITFAIPAYSALDVSFQGMNTWHSFQYLALIWYVNRLRAERHDVTFVFLRRITGPGSGRVYYGTLIGVTLVAGAVVGLLHSATRLTLEQCYFMVVLSFLLVHYYFDTFLFTRGDALLRG